MVQREIFQAYSGREQVQQNIRPMMEGWDNLRTNF
jgi:hypothetical protein